MSLEKSGALGTKTTVLTWHQELADTPLRIITFTQLPDGEIFVVDYEGAIYRLVRQSEQVANDEFPTRLSETGLFANTVDLNPEAGVLPYEIRADHWADHTFAERVIGLPDERNFLSTKRMSVILDKSKEIFHS